MEHQAIGIAKSKATAIHLTKSLLSKNKTSNMVAPFIL